jgi:hypothetical protein
MDQINSPSFIEILKAQIKEEFNNYRSALNSNKEFWELKQIKEKIKRLQNTLDAIMNNLRNYTPQNSATILDR